MIAMDELTPLERFYFENASKDDLIYEVMQLRAELKSVSSAIAENHRLTRELEKLRKSLEVKDCELKRKTALLSAFRRKHNIQPRTAVRSEILTLMEKGLKNSEIIKNGYNENTVYSTRRLYNSAK